MLFYATVTLTVNFHATQYECLTIIKCCEVEVYESEFGGDKLDIYKEIRIQMVNKWAIYE